MTVEGVTAALCAHELAEKLGVEMPITEQIYRLIEGEVTAGRRSPLCWDGRSATKVKQTGLARSAETENKTTRRDADTAFRARFLPFQPGFASSVTTIPDACSDTRTRRGLMAAAKIPPPAPGAVIRYCPRGIEPHIAPGGARWQKPAVSQSGLSLSMSTPPFLFRPHFTRRGKIRHHPWGDFFEKILIWGCFSELPRRPRRFSIVHPPAECYNETKSDRKAG